MSGPDSFATALLPFFASVAEQSRERALLLAQERAAAQAPTELLSFKVAAEMFALPLSQVQEICRIEALTAVPRAAPETLGLMSLRGEVIPVVDLAAVLGLAVCAASVAQGPSAPPMRALLLQDDNGPLALNVKEVLGVVRILPHDLATKPFGLTAKHTELVSGMARTARGTITLLDGTGILRLLERLS